MYFLYSFLFTAWVIIMIPYFLYNGFKNKKYLPNLLERTGQLPDSLRCDGRKTIWIHSCSVGETLSVQPLAHLLSERMPDARLVFSVVTRTGRKIADERFAKYGKGNVFYFPIDLPFFVDRVLNTVQPDALITIDTEIWPNVLRRCKERGIPIIMANGRISAESFQYYQWVQPFMGQILSNYAYLLMKDQEDADRITRMGAFPSKISVTGNMKYDRDVVEKDVADNIKNSIDKSFNLSSSGTPILLAGSTHDGEEAILLEVLQRLRATVAGKDTRLLLVPRHPERFSPVAALAERTGFTVARRTVGLGDGKAEVLLLDTLGELGAAYQFATIAFVGGTLIPHGGQSIMEPALYGKAIVVGPHCENFPGIIDDFIEHNAIRQIEADEKEKTLQADQLTAVFTELLANQSARIELGARAQSLFGRSKGATAFIVNKVVAAMEKLS